MAAGKAFLRRIRVIGVVLAMALASASQAQNWPERPVRIVVPFAVGSFTDTYARQFAQRLSEKLRGSFVVEAKGGAAGIIGVDFVAKSAPDGYTILFAGGAPLAVNPAIYKSLPYDALNDFAPIAYLGETGYYMIVPPRSPHRSFAELVAAGKARPNAISIGGGNSNALLGVELFKLLIGTEVTSVPYKAAGAGLTEMLGGNIDAMIVDAGFAAGQLRANAVRGLAITTPRRSVLFPDIPTVNEVGYPDLQVIKGWFGSWAPARTPVAILDRLNAAFTESKAEMAQQIRNAGNSMDAAGPSREDFGRFHREDIERFRKLIRDARVPLK